MKIRVGRYHNIFGTHGIGKVVEKPAAFGGVALADNRKIVWGDGDKRSYILMNV